MKKYLKCIKKLPLAKSILGCLIFLIGSSYALADSTYYLKGKVTTFGFKDNKEEICNFSIDNYPAPAPAENKGVCNFLKKAMEHNQNVSVAVGVITHYLGMGSNTYEISVNFLNRQASWPTGTKEDFSFKYLLEGNVEDVYVTNSGICYVAVSGPDVRNNKDFHDTKDMKICDLAEDAFYLGTRVRMIATVDNRKEGYANDINDFRVTQCCTRSQRN